MYTVKLSEIGRDMAAEVGGKAAALGEIVRIGGRVPEGFVLTTAAHATRVIPERELRDAYWNLGAGRVAVRSSATAEDLPGASFAGQMDTFLDVQGEGPLLDAVRACWDSLDSERATAYRRASGYDAGAQPGEGRRAGGAAGGAGTDSSAGLGMAVIVQRMVDPAVAGVLFTANPLTGCRDEMVVDAAPGLGTAVVDGTAVADHYLLRAPEPPQVSAPLRIPVPGNGAPPDGPAPGNDGGCLTPDQLEVLRGAGSWLQRHFGRPQDIEWAFDRDGSLWLLQSRPITTLFPLPPETGLPTPRAYLEVGNVQGMLRPFTPMGMSAMMAGTELWFREAGLDDGRPTRSGGGRWDIRRGRRRPAAGVSCLPGGQDTGPSFVTDIGGRLYADMTGVLRSRAARKNLATSMRVYGPRVVAAVERLLEDPRFSAQAGPAPGARTARQVLLRLLPSAVVGIGWAVANPAAARARTRRGLEDIRRRSVPPAGLATAADHLRFALEVQKPFMRPGMAGLMWPLFAGILVSQLPAALLGKVASPAELATALGGLPHNVTTEMDLELWRLAARAGERHRDLLVGTDAAELAERYLRGGLPDIGLEAFLARYGHRAAAEVDIGVPRWAEDPTPVFGTIANYLRLEDPEQAPDRRFARAGERAEAMVGELAERGRRARPVRGRLAAFFLRRSRELTGLREIGKFGWLYALAEMRRQLLLVGAELEDRGLLEQAGDVFFLTLPEAQAAVAGTDHRPLVVERRRTHAREVQRRHVPVVLLSDGTDVEATAPRPPSAPGVLAGLGAAPGRCTARARIVRDPAGAHLEPGEILVAPTTDPGWTPLFLTAGGLVTEAGATMAHGPTVAREYGIPAVICVARATEEIADGQLIAIDGAAGTVELHPV